MENEIKLIWKEFNDMGPLSGYSRFNMEVCAVKKKVSKVYSVAWLTHLSTDGLLRSWMFGWKCHAASWLPLSKESKMFVWRLHPIPWHPF